MLLLANCCAAHSPFVHSLISSHSIALAVVCRRRCCCCCCCSLVAFPALWFAWSNTMPAAAALEAAAAEAACWLCELHSHRASQLVERNSPAVHLANVPDLPARSARSFRCCCKCNQQQQLQLQLQHWPRKLLQWRRSNTMTA